MTTRQPEHNATAVTNTTETNPIIADLMADPVALLEYMVAKISHDFAGPFGALASISDFLNKNNETRAQATKLVVNCSTESVNRLEYFRAAFGTASTVGDQSINSIINIVENYFKAQRLVITWHESCFDHQELFNNHTNKVLLNALFLQSAVLIYGGRVIIKLNRSNNDTNIEINGVSESIKSNLDIDMLFSNHDSSSNVARFELSSSNVQFAYLKVLLHQYRSQHKLVISDQSCNFKFSLSEKMHSLIT